MINPDFYSYVIIPLLIIIARILDQTIGTLRLIYLSKGFKSIAPLMGFFEVFIWILAVSQIFQQLDNYVNYFAYATGFALGNYFGLRLEEKLSLGKIVIRIFPKQFIEEITKDIREKGFGLTIIDANGAKGQVKILLSIIDRKMLNSYLKIIHKYNQNVFYTIEDVRTSIDGVFPIVERKRRRISGLIKFK